MRGRLWRCLTLMTLLAPLLLLAACNGPAGGDASSPPPSASAAAPSDSQLPSAPAPSASQLPSIAEQFIQRASAPDAQPDELLADLKAGLAQVSKPEQADAMLRAMDAYYAAHLQEMQQAYEGQRVQAALSTLPDQATDEQIAGMSVTDARTLLQLTLAGGYKLTSAETSTFPIVDYAVMAEMADKATPAMQAYLAVMAVESDNRVARDIKQE